MKKILGMAQPSYKDKQHVHKELYKVTLPSSTIIAWNN